MRTVLVVEDEVSIADVITAFLEDTGFRVLKATNGREALTPLEQVRPDLVLADVMIPLMDGRELCQAMEDDPAYRSIPVVLMSAVGERPVAGRCRYAAFVAKPFDLDTLLDTITTLMQD